MDGAGLARRRDSSAAPLPSVVRHTTGYQAASTSGSVGVARPADHSPGDAGPSQRIGHVPPVDKGGRAGEVGGTDRSVRVVVGLDDDGVGRLAEVVRAEAQLLE